MTNDQIFLNLYLSYLKLQLRVIEMILAKVHTTPKQRDEFRLLIAIRFASLMALAKSNNEPIECPRVQTKPVS